MLIVIANTLNHSWVRKSLQFAVFFLILVFIVIAVSENYQQLIDYDWQINWFLLALSIVLIILTTLFGAFLWALILNNFSQKLSRTELVAIWLKSQMAKYLPGGIWNLVGRAYLCQQGGIMIKDIAMSLLLETGLNIMAQFLVILLLGGFSFNFIFGDYYLLLIGLVVIGSVVMTHPKVLTRILSLLARLSLKGREMDLPFIEQKKLIGLLALYALFTISGGITFYTFINSVYDLPLTTLPAIIVIVTLSFLIGFLSPLTPNGLGVREGVFSLLLSQFVPLHVAIVIALAARIWLIVGEVLSTGLGILLGSYVEHNKQAST